MTDPQTASRTAGGIVSGLTSIVLGAVSQWQEHATWVVVFVGAFCTGSLAALTLYDNIRRRLARQTEIEARKDRPE